MPALVLDGRIPLPGGGGTMAAQVRRESAWEGGASFEAQLTPAFRVMVGGGGRTATDWSGITASNGVSAQAAFAGEYHDPELPWAVRFGIGRESNPGTCESAARQFGLGLGWIDGSLRYDFAILHRGLERSGAPNSSDDRVVASITLAPGRAAPGR